MIATKLTTYSINSQVENLERKKTLNLRRSSLIAVKINT